MNIKKLDWIGIIAIVIMLVGCYLVVQEGKDCKDPYRSMIDAYLVDELKLNYSYAIISVYATPNDAIPLATFDLIQQRLKIRKILSLIFYG